MFLAQQQLSKNIACTLNLKQTTQVSQLVAILLVQSALTAARNNVVSMFILPGSSMTNLSSQDMSLEWPLLNHYNLIRDLGSGVDSTIASDALIFVYPGGELLMNKAAMLLQIWRTMCLHRLHALSNKRIHGLLCDKVTFDPSGLRLEFLPQTRNFVVRHFRRSQRYVLCQSGKW